jgi:hypothetical protein
MSSIELLYENKTNTLLLKDDKLHYFPAKKQFDRLVQVDVKTGVSRLEYLFGFPWSLEAINSRDLNVKFCTHILVNFLILDRR